MRIRFAAFALAATALVALPGEAAAPPFDTPATVAFMKDLSSGAILFQKNPDQRIPPASLAKMMTVYVAFDMIKKGQLHLNDMATVNPETWKKWHGPAAGSTMFLSPGEQVSVANLLLGIITLSGNDACVVLAEHIAGTEPAFTALMAAEFQMVSGEGDVYSLEEIQAWLDATRWRFVEHRPLDAIAGLVVAEAG